MRFPFWQNCTASLSACVYMSQMYLSAPHDTVCFEILGSDSLIETSTPVANGHLAELALAFHGPLENNTGQNTTGKGECRIDQRHLSGLIREHLLQTGVDQKD